MEKIGDQIQALNEKLEGYKVELAENLAVLIQEFECSTGTDVTKIWCHHQTRADSCGSAHQMPTKTWLVIETRLANKWVD